MRNWCSDTEHLHKLMNFCGHTPMNRSAHSHCPNKVNESNINSWQVFDKQRKNSDPFLDAGSDAANLSTLATSDGSDFVLNGRKAWFVFWQFYLLIFNSPTSSIVNHRITSAHEAKAAIIFARANKNDAQRGITAFLVDMHAPGVRLSSKEEKLGIRATSTSDIILEQVRVPRGNVIGEIGEGFKIAMSQMQLGRIGVASQALGIGQAALDLAIQYACERKTFGYPLIDKQLVKVRFHCRF